MKTSVDADLCISCAVCTNMVPDVFVMNDDGIAEAVGDGTVADEFAEAVREAAEECPADAIIIE